MGCGPAAAAAKAVGVDLASQAVIQGTVVREDQPVKGAYVRLLDASGEFTAEVPTGESGDFRFFAGTGTWTVRVLAPGSAPAEATVDAAVGSVTEVDLTL
jgi:uncharacterized protein DUF1416